MTVADAVRLKEELTKAIDDAENTPEEEMSEMEIRLLSWLSDDTSGEIPMERMKHIVKARAAELLSLAKQQLLQSGELLTKEHHEKLMETQYNETLEGVKKSWHDYFTPQAVTDIYNAGRNDVLKDLPRWKKATGKERFNERMIVLAGDNDLYCTNYAEEGEYYLPFPILEKLPKEDESHE